MPGPYPKEFREDVVAVAKRRESGLTIKQIATDFGISEATQVGQCQVPRLQPRLIPPCALRVLDRWTATKSRSTETND